MKRSRDHWLLLLFAIAAGVLISQWLQRPAPPPETVRIEEGKTIDFSSGQAVVKDDAADRAAMAKAKEEIDEATAGVTFAPTKKSGDEAHPESSE